MEKPSFKGYMRVLILDLLREPNHGYGIMAQLEREYGIKLSAGTVYPILASLKRSGLIEVVGEGKRDKKTYRATEKGIKYLEENRNELKEIKRKMRAYKTFLNLGGDELKGSFKELFNRIETLNEDQKEELRKVFKECAERIRRVIL